MPTIEPLTGPTHGPSAPNEKPTSLIYLLHGVGSNGNDLAQLAPYLAYSASGAKFICPDAPFPFDMGMMGRQWFSMSSWDMDLGEAGLRDSFPRLETTVQHDLKAHGLGPGEFFLCGFSQGAMMSLFCGPRMNPGPRGIVAWSGGLVRPETLLTEGKSKPPVLLVHGAADMVVPPEFSRSSGKALREQGFDVESHIVPMVPHMIDPQGLQLAQRFFRHFFFEMPVGSEEASSVNTSS